MYGAQRIDSNGSKRGISNKLLTVIAKSTLSGQREVLIRHYCGHEQTPFMLSHVYGKETEIVYSPSFCHSVFCRFNNVFTLSNYDYLRAAKMMTCNSANNFNDNPKSALWADAHQEACVTTRVLYHFVALLCGQLWSGNCLYQQKNTLTTLAIANTIVGPFACVRVGSLQQKLFT